MQACRSGPRVSHLFFANDSMVFLKANTSESEMVKYLLKLYEESSGQKINFEKSGLFFSGNTSSRAKEVIKDVLGIQSITNLEKYLDLPSMVGRDKRKTFRQIKERIQSKMNSWSHRTLSYGGKEIFIKAVIQAIPFYTMSCFLLPKNLCDELNGIIRNYWWRQKLDKKGIHWINQDVLCASKVKGGMGFKNMEKIQPSSAL